MTNNEAKQKKKADIPGKRQLCLWKTQRRINSTDQVFSRFPGWTIRATRDIEKRPTVITYLPPIETPITDYGTMFEVFHKSEQLSRQANMKYTHITFDCGAIMKAYHVVWNNPDRFKNIILHLGDFHCMKAFFSVLGSFVAGSGFEEIVYQAGLCQPGTIKSILDGKHYNRAFLLHESLAEAIFRLFQQKISLKVPHQLQNLKPEDTKDNVFSLEVEDFIQKYYSCFDDGLIGKHGKTAAYWLRYVHLVDLLHSLHYAIMSNDFDGRLAAWKELLPTFFFFDKTHYARYGSYYVKAMENIDVTHPGAKEELMQIGISVRRNDFGVGQAVDLAGEQTYMRNAKTSGGITPFKTRKGAVLKWVLNRPLQTAFVDTMKIASGLEKTTNNPRKCLRPSEILKSEKIVSNILTILTDQFLSPFDINLKNDELYNLVSGRPVSCAVSDSLLNAIDTGVASHIAFSLRLDANGSKSFFDTISRTKPRTFLDEKLKMKVKRADKTEVTVQRAILGALLA